MIKFFRHIRKSLLIENKTGKYIKYAIGEIVLVVIGILIALNINNWNEANKLKTQEIKIYKEILSDMSLTLSEVEKDMKAHNYALQQNKILLEHLVNRRPYSDSIFRLMFSLNIDLQVYPKTSGYDALNSIGLNLLSNDSIRIEITNLYQLYLQRAVNIGWRETPTESIKQLMNPYMRKHFAIDAKRKASRIINYAEDSITMYYSKIRDYNALLADHEFQEQLNYSIVKRTTKIDVHFRVIGRINHAILSIEKELERLEN